jgi:hypothetical protein
VRWKCLTQRIWRRLCLNACLVMRCGFEGWVLINKSKAEKARDETSTRAATRASRRVKTTSKLETRIVGAAEVVVTAVGQPGGSGGNGDGGPSASETPCNHAAQV